jgi:hypothetical protein
MSIERPEPPRGNADSEYNPYVHRRILFPGLALATVLSAAVPSRAAYPLNYMQGGWKGQARCERGPFAGFTRATWDNPRVPFGLTKCNQKDLSDTSRCDYTSAVPVPLSLSAQQQADGSFRFDVDAGGTAFGPVFLRPSGEGWAGIVKPADGHDLHMSFTKTLTGRWDGLSCDGITKIFEKGKKPSKKTFKTFAQATCEERAKAAGGGEYDPALHAYHTYHAMPHRASLSWQPSPEGRSVFLWLNFALLSTNYDGERLICNGRLDKAPSP